MKTNNDINNTEIQCSHFLKDKKIIIPSEFNKLVFRHSLDYITETQN